MSKRRYKREQEENGNYLNKLLMQFNEKVPDLIATAPMLRVYPELLALREQLHVRWYHYAKMNNRNPKKIVKLRLDNFNKFSFLVIVTFICQQYYDCEHPDPNAILSHYADGLDPEESASQIIANEQFTDPQ